MEKAKSMVVALLFISCKTKPDHLYRIIDTVNDTYGYINSHHDTVIALGKYDICFTDTFKNYAIVAELRHGFFGIDRSEKKLFEVYNFDNGPDYPSEGYFRIIEKGKFGYADTNGNIKLKPRFGCALPFENGVARVAMDCVVKYADRYHEHSYWVSSNWFYIDKAGRKLAR